MTTRRSRRAFLVAASLGLATAASGCAYFNPRQTFDFYQAADGTNANPQGVGVRNAMLVVDASGKGTLYTTVTNTLDKDSTAHLEGSYQGSAVFSAEVPVKAGSVTPVGGSGQQKIDATSVAAPAGSIMELTVSSPDQDPVTISMPVVDSAAAFVGGSDGGQG